MVIELSPQRLGVIWLPKPPLAVGARAFIPLLFYLVLFYRVR